jgi:hypothetical protein
MISLQRKKDKPSEKFFSTMMTNPCKFNKFSKFSENALYYLAYYLAVFWTFI